VTAVAGRHQGLGVHDDAVDEQSPSVDGLLAALVGSGRS
jgi:hypothetical protein